MIALVNRTGALLLAAMMLAGIEGTLVAMAFKEGLALQIMLTSVLMSIAMATYINLSGDGRRLRRAMIATGLGLLLAIAANVLVPGQYRAQAASVAIAAMIIVALWLIPQMALQQLVARSLMRLRPS